MPPKTRARAVKSPLTPLDDVPDGRSSTKGKSGKGSKKETSSKNAKEPKTNNTPSRTITTNSRATRTSTRAGHSHEHSHHHPECDPSNDTIQVILIGLYILRIVFCLLPQHGYISSDEFFLFTEPIAGDIFRSKVVIPEEYDIRYPQASSFFPLMVSGPPFGVLSVLSDVFGYVDTSPAATKNANPDGDVQSGHPVPPVYWILVLPRLVVTILSFIVDWSIARFLLPFGNVSSKGSSEQQTMAGNPLGTISVNNIRLMFASSFIAMTFMTRTLWNTIEVIVFTVLLLNAIVYHKMTAKDSSTWTAYAIGCMISVGMFNRPTFLILAAYPVLWSVVGHAKIRSASDSFVKLVKIAPMIIIQSLIFIAFDTTYYSDIVDTDWLKLPLSDWIGVIKDKTVLTSINFMRKGLASFDFSVSSVTNSDGSHIPTRLTHLLINLPLMISIIIIPLTFDIVRSFYNVIRGNKNANKHLSPDWFMMLWTVVISLALFSISDNQELRTLIPLFVPICYMYRQLVRSRLFVVIWIISNLLLTLLYGVALDGGVTKSMFHLHDAIHGIGADTNKLVTSHALGHQHVIFTSMAQPPHHLLNIAEDNNLIRIFDYTNRKFPDDLYHHFNLLESKNMTSKVTSYLVHPSCLDANVEAILRSTIAGANVQKILSVFPHVSKELFWKSIDTFLVTNYDFVRAFSLTIWKING